MITSIFKKTIRNCFEVLNFTDKEAEKLWNETKEAVEEECEKRLPKIKNQMKANWISE